MSELPAGTVTFMFTDIQGSTRLLQELGDAYESLQNLHSAILRNAISEFDGVVVRTEGDSFFAVFHSPVQALKAAVAAQRELATQDWPHGETLRVRMGLHTGEGRLGGDDYVGIDVNRAARLAAAAHGGQVVVSDATRALVAHALPEGVALQGLGEHRLKDIGHAERVYQLVIGGLTSGFPPLKSLDARPNNLPQRLSTFVGREEEAQSVIGLLRQRPLVTLTGPGGTGKTRLALHVARRALPRFADGAFFVDLSSLRDPALVPSAIVQALGLRERPGQPPLEALRQHLQDLQLLLVLDNFEQVVDAAGVVDDLLAAAAGARVLVTSRVALHLDGEQEFFVPPLELPDPARHSDLETLAQYEAVALFVERARSARRDFSVTHENAPAIAEICVRVDGLPLAIELAAARVKVLSPQRILARLERRLPLLTGAARNVPARHRTLRHTIAWSHDLLDESERQLFARLSVFSGGATLEAIDAVCNPGGELGGDALDLVASLVDKSLVRRRETSRGEVRFAMLETIREYAAEQLAATEEQRARRRHAEYFRALAEEAESHFTGDVEWLDRFEQEHDNVRAALRWTLREEDAERGLRLAAALWRFWFQRGHLREGRHWISLALAIPGAQDHAALLARAHIAAGGLAYWLNDFGAARRHYEESVALYRVLDDGRGLAEALFDLAYARLVDEDLEGAERLLRQALELARQSGDRARMGEVAGAMGKLLLGKGAYSEAAVQVQESIRIARELGNRLALADGLSVLAAARLFEGNEAEARPLLLESLSLCRELDNHIGVAISLDGLAVLESEAGRHERAAKLAGMASVITKRAEGGVPPVVHMQLGNPVEAARAALGDELVDRAVQEGGAMDLDAAVAYALEGS